MIKLILIEVFLIIFMRLILLPVTSKRNNERDNDEQ